MLILLDSNRSGIKPGALHYDMPGVTWEGDIATMGDMGHAAWFKDSEGNIMCIDDMTG